MESWLYTWFFLYEHNTSTKLTGFETSIYEHEFKKKRMELLSFHVNYCSKSASSFKCLCDL